MRTTLVIDDELYRRVKAKAALDGRKVTELVEEGLRVVLGIATEPRARRTHHRLRLPIIPKAPGGAVMFAGMTQDEIHRRISDLQTLADGKNDGARVRSSL